jgi:GMP synthase (glutamine-hydrolysing)
VFFLPVAYLSGAPLHTSAPGCHARGLMRALALEHCRSNQLGVYGEVLAERGLDVDVVRLHENESLPDWRAYDALVVMGGPMSAYDEAEHPWLHDEKTAIREAVEAGVPYLGVCLGSQLTRRGTRRS